MSRTYRGTAQVRAGDLREWDVIQLRVETRNRELAWVPVQEVISTRGAMDEIDNRILAGYPSAEFPNIGVSLFLRGQDQRPSPQGDGAQRAGRVAAGVSVIVRVAYTTCYADAANWAELRCLDLVPIQYDIETASKDGWYEANTAQ